MSDNTDIWNLNALCRCCHKDGYFKSLQETYIYEDKMEVYSRMLLETFDIEIKQPLLDASYTICDACIPRLREAAEFKVQVLACETKFQVYCKNELASTECEPVKIEVDVDDEYDADFNQEELEIEIKCDGSQEYPKKEEKDWDGAFTKPIKSEDDSKADIKIVCEPELSGFTKENERKKQRIRKKLKTEKRVKHDLSLEVEVKTESGTLYSCKLCGGSYKDQKEIAEHIQITHRPLHKCLHCDKVFKTKAYRSIHMKKHAADYVFKCPFCEKIFKNKYNLNVHQNTHTKSNLYRCDICSKEFSYKQSLRVHMGGHYGTKKKCVCHICGRGFNDKTNLEAHIRTVHEKLRPFACEMCPRTFTAKKHLTVHIRKHTGETPFECDECQKKFITVTALKVHKNSAHCAEKKHYLCKVCCKKFFEKKLFLRHQRRNHSGQKPYKCNLCNKDFVCKYSMNRHVFQHTGEKPFVCQICGAKFGQKGALNRHTKRKHVVLKQGVPVKCGECNKNIRDIKKHMLCHNNKRFPCEYCGKSYSENNVLTRHKNVVHFGLKPHQCEYCDKKYCKVNSLKNHQMKVHKVVSKIENDEDFDSEVAKFSIKNKKGRIKTEDGLVDDQVFNTDVEGIQS